MCVCVCVCLYLVFVCVCVCVRVCSSHALHACWCTHDRVKRAQKVLKWECTNSRDSNGYSTEDCWPCVQVCCSVLQCVAVCCSVLQCVLVRCRHCIMLQRVVVCRSLLKGRPARHCVHTWPELTISVDKVFPVSLCQD